MSEFSVEVSDRICKHMNDDHANAVVLYAQNFGGLSNATAAEMVSIDSQGMNLMAQLTSTPYLKVWDSKDHSLGFLFPRVGLQ